jgi:hypothetical protein
VSDTATPEGTARETGAVRETAVRESGAAHEPVVSIPAAVHAVPMRARDQALRVVGVCGAVVGYGFLAAFLILIGIQIYRWFRQDEWTHVGVIEGLRVGLTHCCLKDPDVGRLAALVHWLDAPVDWLGLHKVLEVLPASLALFAISILGNSIFIYCRDRTGGHPGA